MKFAAITCFLTSMGLENAFLRSMDLSFWSVNLCSFIATASKNHVEMSLGRPSLELIKESARLGLALDWKNVWKKTERIVHELFTDAPGGTLGKLGSGQCLEVAEKLLKDIVPAGAPQEIWRCTPWQKRKQSKCCASFVSTCFDIITT